MEMEEVRRVAVHVYSQSNNVIQVPYKPSEDETVSADVIYKKLFETLGFRESSHRFFMLTVCGKDGPEKRIKTTDSISPLSKDRHLQLQKCVFDPGEERTLYTDPAALHLLCTEARFRIEAGELKPSEKQLAQLEEYSDPKFCMEEAYVKLCQTLPDYFTVTCHNVILLQNYDKIKVNSCHINSCFEEDEEVTWKPPVKLAQDTVFHLTVAKFGLQLNAETKNYFVSWKHIRSWTYDMEEKASSLSFCVTCQSGADCILAVTAPQLPFLVSMVMEMIRAVQLQLKDKPVFLAEMIKINGSSTTWENALYQCSELTQRDITQGIDLTIG